MSRATDSGVPHVVTSGTHRTRVSEMRDAAARSGRPSTHVVREARTTPAAGTPATSPRRALARRLPEHSGSS
jgi:hypothetical protein